MGSGTSPKTLCSDHSHCLTWLTAPWKSHIHKMLCIWLTRSWGCVFDSLWAERHSKRPVSRALIETISFRYLTFCLTNNAILIGAHKSLAKIHIRKVWRNEACVKCFEKFWPITGAPKNGTLVEGCSHGWGEPERAPITLFWLALKPYKSRK